MKKGLTYIDVAISVGIFVIYALFLFITFRPAIEEEYDDDYLTTIVQSNFIKDTYWSLSKIPITITPQDYVIGKAVSITFPFGWEDNSVYVTDDNNEEVNIEINTNTMTIENYDEWTKKQFFAYHSDEFSSYFHTPFIGDRMRILDENVFVGVAEVSHGIQKFSLDSSGKDKFSLLFDTPYDQLKEKWYYPKKKEFFIEIDYDGGEKDSVGTNPNDLNINTKINKLTFSSRLLNEHGESSQVVIYLYTW